MGDDRVLRMPNGDMITIRHSSAETKGAFFEIEAVIPPRTSGPPAHLHLREEESFAVVEGRLWVRCGKERIELGPGESATVPPNTAHTFANRTDQPVTVVTRSTPAGLLEQMFRLQATSKRPPLLRVAEINHGKDATFFLAAIPVAPQRLMWNGLAGLASLGRLVRRG